MRFADQELDQTALDVFKLFDPLRGPLDILDNVVQLATWPFAPPDVHVSRLFVLRAQKFDFERVYVVAEEDRLGNEVEDVARATDPLAFGTELKLLRECRYAGSVVASVVRNEVTQTVAQVVLCNDTTNSFRYVGARMPPMLSWQAQ